MYRSVSTTIFASTTLAIALAWSPAAWAQGHEGHAEHADHATQPAAHEHGEKEAPKRVGDAYPLNVDPVTGEELAGVDQPVVLLHEGRELHFANEENAEKFKADPEAYLPKIDKLIVEQQKPLYPLETCVVSGEKLGGDMGKPIDFVYGNRLVRFCCPGCIGQFKKDPAKYLKQIDAAVIEQQQEDYPLETCLVSGEKLGGDMGEPINFVSGNRLVRFCCKGCVKTFEKNPAHYLAKLHHEAMHDEHADKPDAEHGHSDHSAEHGHDEHHHADQH